MKKISFLITLAMLAIGFLVGCASTSTNAGTALELKTGGGVTGPFFAVYLSPSGRLSVQKQSLPFADTKSGLTTDDFEIQLRPADAAELVRLAGLADDFSQGCGVVGHGTSARLWLTREKEILTAFSCNNAADWPLGLRTHRLLSALNRHLPERLHVF